MGQQTRSGRTILGNLVNDVMIADAPPAYARTMASVTPRKVWLAAPGDCVVVLAPCTPVFRDYVAGINGVAPDEYDLVEPDRPFLGHALDLVQELGAVGRVAARPVLQPFVLDRYVTEFAASTGMRIDGYQSPPGPETIAAVRAINTKSGFREIAAGLGLPVAPGGSAATTRELADRLREFLSSRPAAIVKMNRSSNGFATTVVRADHSESVAAQVADIAGQHGESPTGWVYEELLNFTAVPSLELTVGEDGPELFSTCDQRTTNNAWTGMTSPASQAGIDRTYPAALAIGRWLYDRGYRGIFDLDCCLLDRGYVVTEANVRRTGGTYLEELARTLRPGEDQVHWMADARLGAQNLSFEAAADALERAGLADPQASVRVVLTADTVELDGKWRYLIVGADGDQVRAAEEEVSKILELK
jgi:hypothetical protein